MSGHWLKNRGLGIMSLIHLNESHLKVKIYSFDTCIIVIMLKFSNLFILNSHELYSLKREG